MLGKAVKDVIEDEIHRSPVAQYIPTVGDLRLIELIPFRRFQQLDNWVAEIGENLGETKIECSPDLEKIEGSGFFPVKLLERIGAG